MREIDEREGEWRGCVMERLRKQGGLAGPLPAKEVAGGGLGCQ